jgi:hypothetical protein
MMTGAALTELQSTPKIAPEELSSHFSDEQSLSGLELQPPQPCGGGPPGLARMAARSPGARPRAIRPSPLSEPASTDPDPGPHLRLWEATSLAEGMMEAEGMMQRGAWGGILGEAEGAHG